MLESLISDYGYWALFVGTFFEGETIVILGGFAARAGYLELDWVMITSFFGTLLGDQLYFYLSRKYSRRILAKRPAWQTRVDKAQRMMDRFQTFLILFFRFFYGWRTIFPVVFGMSPLSERKFFILNAAGALIWAAALGAAGYLFGGAMEVLLGNVRHYALEVGGVILMAGALSWTIYYLFRRKRGKDLSIKKNNP